jgi:hypothetical protein
MASASGTAQIHEKKIVKREEKVEDGRALSAWVWKK